MNAAPTLTRTDDGEYRVAIDGQAVGLVRRYRQSTQLLAPGASYSYANNVCTRWAAFHGTRRIGAYRTRTQAVEALVWAIEMAAARAARGL
jgi:hypothetical protein